ncbi:hypothetical protein, partial [Bulleidia sp. HCP3S3_C9]|uniref:hypothetical protein n=1 Tax=Bulleidia sp. HCP3S3_C9 TaxID=3438914 RepID=UPI003F893A0C
CLKDSRRLSGNSYGLLFSFYPFRKMMITNTIIKKDAWKCTSKYLNVDFSSRPHEHHVILEYVKTSSNFG